MNEQEKKAIEKLKKIIEDTIKANECGLSNNDFKEEIEVYDTVLNLITKLQKHLNFYEKNESYKERIIELKEEITKLQKENEYWKNGFERELEKNRRNTCELLKQDLIIREKDKQIDLIIEEYEYNDRINFKNFCEDELRKDSCIQDCKLCAKHYFEKLAKEKDI